MTHVVAAKDGTDKALEARKIPNCVLVKPSWLIECYWSLTYRDVKPHLLQGVGTTIMQQTSLREKQQHVLPMQVPDNSGDVTDDEDDDDFVAEMEDELMRNLED